ncbi:MAG: tetratricopeptide repeat protein [Herminiimonas sp.]|nr:tetratricopeptide repeat protein [Herminiimonas sp.]
MAYDLEEQEQLATMKAWWSRYGNLVTWLVIAALAVYSGWSAWNYYLRNQSAQAGQLYEEVQKSVAAKDSARLLRAAGDMQEKFPRTAYAEMTGLAAAKVAFDANDMKNAKAQLQWVSENGADEEYRAVARVRLAGILLDEKAYDDGLKVLAGEVLPAFVGVVADRRGDLLVAQGKTAEARSAYQAALAKMDQKNPGRLLIQLKLDALGGAAPSPKAPA